MKIKQRPIFSDLLSIVYAYRESKEERVPFDCPFCQRIVPPGEKHYEEGICSGFADEAGRGNA